MTELARSILAVFAESYPTSAHFKGGRRLRKSGWERLFPLIEKDVTAKNDFLDAVEELVSAKILSARWKRFREGDELAALYLEDARAMFSALEMQSPEEKARGMLSLVAGPGWAGGSSPVRLAELAAYLGPRLEAGHPVPVSSVDELSDLGRLFSLAREEAAALPIRALSIRLYGDSKRLERLLPVADRLSRAVWGAPISEELGLGRSYPEVSFAVLGSIRFSGSESSWRCNGQILTLPLASVRLIKEVAPERGEMATADPPLNRSAAVLSVENKETFHVLASRLPGSCARRSSTAPEARSEATEASLPVGIAAILYTAGHPNGAVTAMLRHFAAAGARFYHYGDLDPDGILILQEIQAAVAAPVVPYLMTVSVYRRFARHGYPLDQTQRARLAQLDPNTQAELRELAREIGKTGVGVEQEIIDVFGVHRC